MHPQKNRSVGNSKFLLFHDNFIIKSFGYFAYIFLNWFRCAYNFSKLKNIIDIIRQSCFLTLCRKHNKNKNWAYNIYTSDLILLQTFSSNKSFFPSKMNLFRMKRKFFFLQKDIFFDDEFFLIF